MGQISTAVSEDVLSRLSAAVDDATDKVVDYIKESLSIPCPVYNGIADFGGPHHDPQGGVPPFTETGALKDGITATKTEEGGDIVVTIRSERNGDSEVPVELEFGVLGRIPAYPYMAPGRNAAMRIFPDTLRDHLQAVV